jgi:hypothetical protein
MKQSARLQPRFKLMEGMIAKASRDTVVEKTPNLALNVVRCTVRDKPVTHPLFKRVLCASLAPVSANNSALSPPPIRAGALAAGESPADARKLLGNV